MFQNGDIICFLGDSITASGLWEAEVYQYLRKKYRVKCYNCGVSGAIAEKVVGYLYAECLIYNPDYVVLMLGVNDLDISLYTSAEAGNPWEQAKRERRFQVHMRAYEKIVTECQKSGTKVIICLPTPYDEISNCDTPRRFYQSALEKACDFQLEIARKYGCRVVSFKDHMLPMLPKADIIRPDRVHPTEYGYHVMAQIFLKEIGQIEACDFDTPFVLEDWNKKRHEAEMKNHKLNYVELCDIYFEGYAQNKSPDEIKQIAKQRLEAYAGESEFIPEAYREYMENGHLRFRNKGEVVKLTIY